MNSSSQLRDIQIAHQIAVQRYGAGISRQIVKLLNSADDDLTATIAKRLALIDQRGFDIGPASTKRLEDMLFELRVLNAGVYSRVGKELEKELTSFAQYEMEYQAKAMERAVPLVLAAKIPPASFLKAIVTERPFQGVLLKDWVSGMASARIDRISQAIKIGLVESETLDKIVRRIRGSAVLKFADGILNISRRSAQTMVRTAVNHVSTQAREETYSANSDLISGVQWVSTLDGRTSPVCRARDGKIFEPDKGPRPPAHHGCRSTTIPILKSWQELGIDANEATPGIRASMDGAVPADTTYGDFLKRKGAAFQDDVMGKAKAEAFRKGLPLDGFVDASGKEYNLDQLRRLNPEFF